MLKEDNKSMLKIKRVYDKPNKSDGIRILVDRLWPRGLTKKDTKINKWVREIAPSDSLRKWFAHREKRWEEFKRSYKEELKDKKNLLNELKRPFKNSTVTLLYAAKDKERNNAQVLLEFLEKK